jgi:bifunctional non-homologous end joining protein LigD
LNSSTTASEQLHTSLTGSADSSRGGTISTRVSLPLQAAITGELRVTDAILDGEIVCLDAEGRSIFKEQLYRRGNPVFYAFDLLWLNGRDLRHLPLIERNRMLRTLIRFRRHGCLMHARFGILGTSLEPLG